MDFTQLPKLQHTRVVGLGHRARNGKDTVANVLVDVLGSRARRFSFADGLRAYARIAHGMTHKDASLLQRVGGDVRAGKDPFIGGSKDTWLTPVIWAIAEWDAEATGTQIAIVTDVRHVNEAEMVKALGGKTIRVRRYNEDGSPFIDPSRDPNHPSEVDLQDYAWDLELGASSVDQLLSNASQMFQPVFAQIMNERFGVEMVDFFGIASKAIYEELAENGPLNLDHSDEPQELGAVS